MYEIAGTGVGIKGTVACGYRPVLSFQLLFTRRSFSFFEWPFYTGFTVMQVFSITRLKQPAIGKVWLNYRIKPRMYVRLSTMYEIAPFY